MTNAVSRLYFRSVTGGNKRLGDWIRAVTVWEVVYAQNTRKKGVLERDDT